MTAKARHLEVVDAGRLKVGPAFFVAVEEWCLRMPGFFRSGYDGGVPVLVGAVTSLADVEIDGRWQGEKPGFARGGLEAGS